MLTLDIIHMTSTLQTLYSYHWQYLASRAIRTIDNVSVYQQVQGMETVQEVSITLLFNLALAYLERRFLVARYL
jgi:hypothetical protein